MKFNPMLDGFELELLAGIDTAIEKAIVEYEIPFADGGILDDMGVKARRFSFKTIWRHDRYGQYEYFTEHCRQNQMNRFVHPESGVVNGRVKSLTVTHDDRLRCAEISVEFLEDVSPDVQPAYTPPLLAALEDAFAKTAAALVEETGADIAENGVDAAGEIDPDKPLAGQLPAQKWSARAYIARLDTGLNALRGAFAGVLNPLDSAVATLNYGLSLPGSIISTVAAAVERAALTATTAANAPAMFAATFSASVNRLAAAVPLFRNRILAVGAGVAALVIGKMFEADETGKTALRRLENTRPWRPDGTFLPPPAMPGVLSAAELDSSLARTLELLRDGITAARATGNASAATALQQQAAALTDYIDNVKMERDRLIIAEIGNDTPLHLICLRHGLPYSYADRICSINDFRNPTFCAGEVRLYARRG